MEDSRNYSGGIEMIIKIGDLQVNGADALKQAIVRLTESNILHPFYHAPPPPTESSVRADITSYKATLANIGRQLANYAQTPEADKIKKGVAKILDYLETTLKTNKTLLDKIDEISDNTIKRVAEIYPALTNEMQKFLDFVKRKASLQRRR